MTRESLGELEQQVLLALLRLKGESYAVPIAECLQTEVGRDVSPTAVYVVLRRLEKRGFLTSRMGDPTPERGGRARRYFHIQPTAIPVLRASRNALLTLWDGLEPVFDES